MAFLQELFASVNRTRRFLIIFCWVIGLSRLGLIARGTYSFWISDKMYGAMLTTLAALLILTMRRRMYMIGRLVAALTAGVLFGYALELVAIHAITSALIVFTICYMAVYETGTTT